MSKQFGPSFALAYFYYNGVQSKDSAGHEQSAENIIACIVKQITIAVDWGKLPEALVELYEKNHQRLTSPTIEQCLELLAVLSTHLSMITLVVDGVDECALSVRRDLLFTLQRLSSAETPVKIFVSSRDESYLRAIVKTWLTRSIDIVAYTKIAINRMIVEKVKDATLEEPSRSNCYSGPDAEARSQDVIVHYKITRKACFSGPRLPWTTCTAVRTPE